MRTSDRALEVLKHVTAGLDATFIFSVWHRAGLKVEGALNIHQVSRIFDASAASCLPASWLGWQNLWRMLPELQTRLLKKSGAGSTDGKIIEDRIRTYFPDALIDIERDDILDLAFDRPQEDANSIRMLYKAWRVNQMKKKIERTQGRFDYVIRIRPDLIITRIDVDLLKSACTPTHVLVDGCHPGFVMDNFACGTSEVLDKYAALFSTAIAMPLSWRFVHHDLHDHLTRCDITYSAYPHIGHIVEDTKITCEELRDCLTKMAQFNGWEAFDGWTFVHEMTRHCAIAAAALDAGDPQAALAQLARVGAIPGSAEADLDGFLFVASRAFLEVGAPEPAALCLLASLRLRDPIAFTNSTAQVALLSRIFLRLTLSDRNGGFDGLLSRIAGAEQPGWLDAITQALTRRYGGETPADLIRSPLEQVLQYEPFYHSVCENASETFTSDDAEALHALAREAGLWDPSRVLFFVSTVHERFGALDRAADALAAGIAQPGYSTKDPAKDLYRLANLLKRLSRFDEACRYQEQAIALDPSNLDGRRQLADICQSLGRLDQAAEQLAHCVKAENGLHNLYRLADLLKRLSRFEEAYVHQKEAVTRDPGHHGARRQLAEICLCLGHYDEARGLAEELLQMAPNHPPFSALVAYACFQQGDESRAVEMARLLPQPLPPSVSELHIPNLAEVIAQLLGKAALALNEPDPCP